MKLDLQEIETFLRVVELGSVSQAAQRMGLSKSVVSKRLSDLEKHLATRLLHRSTRRVAPSDTGLQFYEQARQALAQLTEAAETAASSESGLRGHLRLQAPMSFGTLWLAPLLAEFMAEQPELRVDLQLDDRILDFEREGYDLCIRISRLGDSALIARRLAASPRVLCCSPDYAARHGVPASAAEIARHPGIGYSNVSTGQVWTFRSPEGDGEPFSLAPQGRFTSNNGEIMCEMAVRGLGLAVLPRFIVQRALDSGALREIDIGATPVDDGIYALYPRAGRGSRKVAALCDFLQARLASAPWLRDAT